VRSALGTAEHQIGDPYRYGAAGPNAFDCSGLTYYSFHHAGFRGLPRTAAAQAGFTNREPRSRMHRGDLVFFTDRGKVYHVGIFIGRHHGHPWILHAPYPGQRVSREQIWTNSWFPGTLR
jgi:cell wall-associated NlpC family hydrolase